MSWELPNDLAIDRGDSTAVLYARVRQLKVRVAGLLAEVRIARLDSVAIERHHKIDIDDLNKRLGWAEDQRIRWFQQPAFVAVVSAVLSIWATLQAIKISI